MRTDREAGDKEEEAEEDMSGVGTVCAGHDREENGWEKVVHVESIAKS